MGIRLDYIKIAEQSLLLENALLKILLLEDERSDLVNPIFDERERERSVASFVLCSQCCWSKHEHFFAYYTKEISFLSVIHFFILTPWP
jgi:hypothetical protein